MTQEELMRCHYKTILLQICPMMTSSLSVTLGKTTTACSLVVSNCYSSIPVLSVISRCYIPSVACFEYMLRIDRYILCSFELKCVHHKMFDRFLVAKLWSHIFSWLVQKHGFTAKFSSGGRPCRLPLECSDIFFFERKRFQDSVLSKQQKKFNVHHHIVVEVDRNAHSSCLEPVVIQNRSITTTGQGVARETARIALT
jgi:hypothetical protein